MRIERIKTMRPATKRLLVACGLYFTIQIPGAVVSVTYGLPGDFVLPGEEPARPDETLGEILSGQGAALVAPPLPLIALIIFMLLALSRRWWGAIGTVGICLLSPLVALAMFMERVTREIFPPSVSEIPVAVMVALFFIVPLLMFVSGVLDLISRARTGKDKAARS
jgi:membrane protease YdiL (CAAX protease family)